VAAPVGGSQVVEVRVSAVGDLPSPTTAHAVELAG
jgi:hypothetical protein